MLCCTGAAGCFFLACLYTIRRAMILAQLLCVSRCAKSARYYRCSSLLVAAPRSSRTRARAGTGKELKFATPKTVESPWFLCLARPSSLLHNACMHAYIHLYMLTHTHRQMRIHTNTHLHIHNHKLMHICIRIYIDIDIVLLL